MKVSIIIPTYNQGKFLDACIESVLKSDFQDFEIILSDDGSNDVFTQKWLKNFKNEKCKIIFQSNQGVSVARNKAIEISQGEYILPLDGDDLIHPNYLSEAVQILDNQNNIDIITCEVELFGAASGKMYLPEISMEQLVCENCIINTSMYRRSAYNRTRGYNANMREGLEDWDFWIEMLKNGAKIIRLNKVLFYYRIKKVSRNQSIDLQRYTRLRKQLFMNHQDVFASVFLDPFKTWEYRSVAQSKEFKIGKILLKPIRKFRNLI